MLQKTKNNFTQFMNELKENVNSNYKFLNPLLLCKTFQKKDVMNYYLKIFDVDKVKLLEKKDVMKQLQKVLY